MIFSLETNQNLYNLTKTPSIPGYTELQLINEVPDIQINGPFRCTAIQKDDYGMMFEARSANISFNLVRFENDDHSIEWHNDTFNEVILVDERQPVKWVIGFTIHRQGLNSACSWSIP